MTYRLPLFFAAALLSNLSAAEPRTEQIFLSGHDTKDAVPWEFQVTGGRRAGESTTIPVPSNWEQHGFGAYDYGQDPRRKSDEHGLYRLRFKIPAQWKDRRIWIVFDGAMTDTSVKVNGQSAGPVHQGGFYRFRYDITGRVEVGGENQLEVDVAKVSSNARTERAERGGDYWVFGGIFRPVFLEALPAQSIEHAAIDARADGTFTADVTLGSVREADRLEAQVLDDAGHAVGGPFTAKMPGGGTGRLSVAGRVPSPRLWSAETPRLYQLRLSLRKGGETLHVVTERFGFRSIEARVGQGLFLNGRRILLKGIGRHSFRPGTARALSREECYEDARLIKAMNMNAVRMTHYPPDVAFLEACDELGLYVIDEVSGWQASHDADVGRRLVRETVTRDVNHPSILFWDNGNEGGWNREVDGEFALYDPQNRLVLHPWELFNGINTQHYPGYRDLEKILAGPNLVMPTEMLHGLYDGGGGAGLEDYWRALSASPFGAGGFIWVLADEGIARTDEGGRVDVFGTFAPDGVVGPHHEKEGSFETIRDVFSPVQIDPPTLDAKFAGKLVVHNGYDFTSLAQCGLTLRLLRFPGPAESGTAPKVLVQGTAALPDVAPRASGELKIPLPVNWRQADALSITALGPDRKELWTWTWAIPAPPPPRIPPKAGPAPQVETAGGEIRLRAGDTTATFDAATGLLRSLQRGGLASPLGNGPRLAFARPPGGETKWLDGKREDAPDSLIFRPDQPRTANLLEVELDYPREVALAGFRLEISPDGRTWKTLFDSVRRDSDHKRYEFPPQTIAAVRLSKLRGSDGHPAKVKDLRLGFEAARFPEIPTKPAKVTSGVAQDLMTGERQAWIESAASSGLDRFRWSLGSSGALRLTYDYSLDGTFCYHGITFDLPEDSMTKLRWRGDGPFRVWKNRLRGPTLGVHETTRADAQPGETWAYPEFEGFFKAVDWAQLGTTAGRLTMENLSAGTYLRVSTPRISHPNTTVSFPAGNLSFLQAIPGIGSKFSAAPQSGPAGQWSTAKGRYSGAVTFTLER